MKQAWKVLLPTGIIFALCGTAVFLLFPRQLLGLFSAREEMLAFGVPALRIISVTFLFAVVTILCGYFASGLGNGGGQHDRRSAAAAGRSCALSVAAHPVLRGGLRLVCILGIGRNRLPLQSVCRPQRIKK